MNVKYKIGEWIVFTDKKTSDKWKQYHETFLYGKVGKIIVIASDSWPYLIEFKEFIDGHSGYGKDGHCRWCRSKEIISLDQLKLKKLLEG